MPVRVGVGASGIERGMTNSAPGASSGFAGGYVPRVGGQSSTVHVRTGLPTNSIPRIRDANGPQGAYVPSTSGVRNPTPPPAANPYTPPPAPKLNRPSQYTPSPNPQYRPSRNAAGGTSNYVPGSPTGTPIRNPRLRSNGRYPGEPGYRARPFDPNDRPPGVSQPPTQPRGLRPTPQTRPATPQQPSSPRQVGRPAPNGTPGHNPNGVGQPGRTQPGGMPANLPRGSESPVALPPTPQPGTRNPIQPGDWQGQPGRLITIRDEVRRNGVVNHYNSWGTYPAPVVAFQLEIPGNSPGTVQGVNYVWHARWDNQPGVQLTWWRGNVDYDVGMWSHNNFIFQDAGQWTPAPPTFDPTIPVPLPPGVPFSPFSPPPEPEPPLQPIPPTVPIAPPAPGLTPVTPPQRPPVTPPQRPPQPVPELPRPPEADLQPPDTPFVPILGPPTTPFAPPTVPPTRWSFRISFRIRFRPEEVPLVCRYIPDPRIVEINAKIDEINRKLGPEIPVVGISGTLTATFANTLFTKAMSTLSMIITIHNAYMLSSAATQSIIWVVDEILEQLNINFKNAEGQDQSLSQVIGGSIESALNSVFGEANVDQVQNLFARANRIVSTAANMLYAIQAIQYSVMGVLEIVGDRVSKIGNALRFAGAVNERAYQFMDDAASQTGRFSKFNRFLNTTTNVTEALEQISYLISEVRGLQEQVNELNQAKTALTTEITGLQNQLDTQQEEAKREMRDQPKPTATALTNQEPDVDRRDPAEVAQFQQ